MAKRRVPLHGKPQGYVVVDDEATKGATVGTNLYNADGSLYVPPTTAAPSGGTSIAATLWSLVQNIPANIRALAALTTSGFVRRASDGTFTTEAVQAYPEGTSFPLTPSDEDKFYRTDLDILWVYRSAISKWLSCQQFESAIYAGDAQPITASGARTGRQAVRSDYQLYVERWVCNTFVASTNSSVSYWTVKLEWFTGSNVGTQIASFTTASDAANNNVAHGQAVAALLDATAKIVAVTGTKSGSTGTPGSLFAYGSLVYRLVAP